VRVITDIDGSVWPGERSVVTIGAYDGLHLGHRAVIDAVVAEARRSGDRSVVVTFDRHPASVVRPESAPRLLTTPEQRLEQFATTEIDAVVIVRFDAAQAQEEARSFVERVFVDGLAARLVVVGEDFHFGRDRSGDVAMLSALGRESDFEVRPLALVRSDSAGIAPISSTAIRAAIAAGDVTTAAAMLGRPFEIRGTVEGGDRRGRTIGFPTANVAVPAGYAIPADGVYAAVHRRPDGSEHACAVNIGRRPTFYADAPVSLVESHLIDTSADLYGEEAAIRFVARLRGEQRFESVDALRAQLTRDVEAARRSLGVVPPEPTP
jgi:riboflavin kinase/FMN adenylyltransferase